MKLYSVVMGYDYDGSHCVGVFSTKEKAVKRLNQKKFSSYDYGMILEFNLDKYQEGHVIQWRTRENPA